MGRRDCYRQKVTGRLINWLFRSPNHTDPTLRAALRSPSRRCIRNRHTRERTMDRTVGMARRKCESRWRAMGYTASISTTLIVRFTPRQFSDVTGSNANGRRPCGRHDFGEGDFLRRPRTDFDTNLPICVQPLAIYMRSYGEEHLHELRSIYADS